MQTLVRRPSGIYVFRLAVPDALRGIIGKREIIASTGTRELALAKIVAGANATEWRQRFLELSRLIVGAGIDSMEHHEIVKVASGSPALLAGGHLPLAMAAAASGLSVDHLLRAAGDGRLGLFARCKLVQGHLLPEEKLELVEPSVGQSAGWIIPSAHQLPKEAVPHACEGLLPLLKTDLPTFVADLLAGTPAIELCALDAPGKPSTWFLPATPIKVTRDALEVAAHEVESLRRAVAAVIEPQRLKAAQEHVRAAIASPKAGRMGERRLSEALEHYITNRVKHDVESPGEIKRIRNGCALLMELQGDLHLSEVTVERLRTFRDERLGKVPAKENKVRLIYKTSSVSQSIAAVNGMDWPVMSPAERDKRMRWIMAWFAWLHRQEWISADPGAPLRGESVETRAEKRKNLARRDDEARDVFSDADLRQIFSAPWFKTGRGDLTRQGTYRTFLPFYFWGPIIGLLSGGPRINEVSQLHLADFRRTDAGTWFIDYNQDAEDKKLKNSASQREVPLHPLLIELGLLKWVSALSNAGHDRLFPELKRDEEKGYGKAATKWFTRFMDGLGFPRDGSLTFHSLRHTFVNALPLDTPERVARQLTGHTRGSDVHDLSYRKDKQPDVALKYVERLQVKLPPITPFDIEAGLKAVADALRRKRD